MDFLFISAKEDNVPLFKANNGLNVVQMMLSVKIQRKSNTLEVIIVLCAGYHVSPITKRRGVIFVFLSQVSLGVAWCSTRSEDCMSHVVIMAEAKFEIGPCVSDVILPVMTRPADTPSKCLWTNHVTLFPCNIKCYSIQSSLAHCSCICILM